MPNHNLIALSISHFLRYKLFFLLFLENLGRCVAFSLRAELLLNGFSDDLANYMRKSREHQESERERNDAIYSVWERASACALIKSQIRIDHQLSDREWERKKEREQQRESAGEETRQRVQRCENQFGQQPYANLTAETWIDLTSLRTHAGEIRAVICGHTRRMIDISASHEDLKINRANFAPPALWGL